MSLAQHSSWKIDLGAARTYRVVAYGDSIFAGYQRSIFKVARRAAPYAAGEYLAHRWGANVEVVRRTVSGALSGEIVDDIQTDRSYMADPSTRAVYFEMCGNDYLQARKRFASASGACSTTDLDNALAGCTRNMESAMTKIVANAPTAKHKAIVNLYYPGFDADDVLARCTNASGQRANVLATLLPYMARSNWRACSLAKRHGFDCVDAFAEYMGADYDSNGDGKVDSEALRFDPNESEAAYVQRITVTLRSTVKDSNRHGLTPTTTADYLFSDDTHPTYYGNTISPGTGRSVPDFTAAQIVGGKNPEWNRHGHERMGWAIAKLAPAAP
ncbi:MAG: SGNH/GDSL hydrolase family protein [Labilithrix sp.]|nr:SGNH/GDSL hydrolase family protein [Labilithrix sp.]MCW5811268.1 SGNH/GDSL hydrolase family protein [Labilithrix sp.]